MKPSPAVRTVRAASLAALAAATLAGCSTTDGLFSAEKVDYRSQAGKTAPLDVPPDLTQMARDGRYQVPTGVVSASTLRQPGAAATATAPVAAGNAVAPTAVGEVKLVRDGSQRWLTSPESPDKLFPVLRSFWAERGFVVVTDSPEVGVLETDWAENRAKLPQDLLRRSLGRVIDSLYSTGERDKFRTRIERNAAGGSDIFLVHRGMEEVYDSELKERTIWRARARDPELEAEMLGRLMVRLGSKEDAARAALSSPAAATATSPVAAARAPSARGPAPLPATATVAVNEGFDRAWRMVGVALDRSGFTVEDRDRSAGLYFVRYIDPRQAGKEEPNFFQKLFSSEKDTRPGRYRVLVQSTNANSTQVTVQNSSGSMDNSEQARQIIGRLIDEMQQR